jgi:hypothetical protein
VLVGRVRWARSLKCVISHDVSDQDDEMTLEWHVSIGFTIESIDILLKKGLIPLSLHLKQADIDIDLLFCSTIQEISNANTALGEKGSALSNKFFFTLLFIRKKKKPQKNYAAPWQSSYSVLLPLLHLILMQKNCLNPHNPQISLGI